MRQSDESKASPCRKHAVILCHPEQDSLNAAIAQTYCDTVRSHNHGAEVRDLYRLNFDPVLKAREQPMPGAFVPAPDVAVELAVLAEADVIVLIYPIWFGTPPAMMKGYVERVLGSDFGHRRMRRRSVGSVVANKHLLGITTSGNSAQWLDEQGVWLSLRTVFDTYLANAFSMASTGHLHFANIVEGLSEQHVGEELYRVARFADAMCAKLQVEIAQPHAIIA